MSNQPKPIRSGNPSASSARKRRNAGTTIIGLAVVVVAALGFWSWNSKRTGVSPATPPPTVAPAASTPPAPMVVVKPGFQKLQGKWLRPDGGYVVEIKSAEASGRLDAAYFNPQPIHVAKAEASLDGAAVKVFIELRDVNYPGSTYTLTYDAAGDQLYGIYYQALQQQRFEVNFVRMK